MCFRLPLPGSCGGRAPRRFVESASHTCSGGTTGNSKEGSETRLLPPGAQLCLHYDWQCVAIVTIGSSMYGIDNRWLFYAPTGYKSLSYAQA